MLERCGNHNNAYWHAYGGKGVTVCDRWKGIKGFPNFLADMGEAHVGLSLDRFPDNDGNYEPNNCRWATWKEQQNNRRNNVVLEYEGARLTIPQWGERIGLPTETLRQRVSKLGWSVKDALTLPKGRKGAWIQQKTGAKTHFDETGTVQLARDREREAELEVTL